jgi:proton glutamate symport protein
MKKNLIAIFGTSLLAASAFLHLYTTHFLLGFCIDLLILILMGYHAFVRKSLTWFILLGMAFGLILGSGAKQLSEISGINFIEFCRGSKLFSDVFLRLIKSIIAPLLLSTLVVGIAGHANLKQVGRMGIKSIIYFELVTTLALVIGLIAINFTGAGRGTSLIPETDQIVKAEKIIEQKQSHNFILEAFPENIAKSIADNQVLQVVIFSILLGMGLAMVKNDEKKKPLLALMESLGEAMFKFTNIVMWLAPFAVFGAMAFAVSNMGISVIGPLLKLVGTLYLALMALVILVFLPVSLLVKLPISKFFQAISEPVSIAFATASSEAALPKAMENLEKMGIPRKIVAFVLPTGYSFNLDGTTLYLSLASVFIAQASGLELSLAEQIQMCLLLMLTSKGVAGVRGASFLILVGTVSTLGLDPQKAFAILAVDALMDMGRTTINVVGNCLATYVIAKWEKEV